MDRRTLLAFGLLTLVLILFQYMSPKRPPATPAPSPTITETGRDTSRGTTAPDQPDRATIGDLGPGTPPESWAEGTFQNILVAPDEATAPVMIRRDSYQAELDPRGGLFTSWILNRYTDENEEPADLVADPGLGLFQIHLVTAEGEVDLSRTVYRVETADLQNPESVNLLAESAGGIKVRIGFQFPKDEHSTKMAVYVENLPTHGRESYFKLIFPAGIEYLERDPKVDHTGAAAVALLGKRYVKKGMGRGEGGWQEVESGLVQWAGTRSKYFLLAAIPDGSPDGEVFMSRPKGGESLVTELRIPMPVDGPADFSFRIYAGPMAYHELERYGVGLEKTVDLGWRVIVPFSRLLLGFFQAVHRVVPNYGVVILILSVLTKLIFYPLTKKSMDSMKQMQLLKPEMDRVNEKFKNDPQRRNQAMMEMYKKHKINPVGGCLPILIQMPVFIALYNVLNTSIELRKAPFVLWIQDLSAPDKVGEVLGFPIHILPLVMAVTMIWQQKLTPTDPRQAAIAYLMPIIMTVFFYPMPSGLVFYWTVNNLMSVGQQLWMNRSTEHQLAAAS